MTAKKKRARSRDVDDYTTCDFADLRFENDVDSDIRDLSVEK